MDGLSIVWREQKFVRPQFQHADELHVEFQFKFKTFGQIIVKSGNVTMEFHTGNYIAANTLAVSAIGSIKEIGWVMYRQNFYKLRIDIQRITKVITITLVNAVNSNQRFQASWIHRRVRYTALDDESSI
jgi:hypothetical protein